jgi:hypothetical protein
MPVSDNIETMRVFVNDRVVYILAGMTVRHAPISAGLLDEFGRKKVYDEWGNEIALDGALSEGTRIFDEIVAYSRLSRHPGARPHGEERVRKYPEKREGRKIGIGNAVDEMPRSFGPEIVERIEKRHQSDREKQPEDRRRIIHAHEDEQSEHRIADRETHVPYADIHKRDKTGQ